MSNVVDLANYRTVTHPTSATTPPPKPKAAWHQRTAVWALFWHQNEPTIHFDPGEVKFLQGMMVWPRDPTDRQAAWLVRLARRVEKQLAMLQLPPSA